MKNILVLTGSARSNSNSDLLAEAFIKGARAAGHTVKKFNTAKKKIYGCIACDTCWSTGYACSLEDDFRELQPLLEEADVLVLASPLYWFGFSAQIKAAIDKLYAYVETRTKRPLKIKEAVLLMSAGGEGQDVFAGAVATYQRIVAYSGWKDAGILTVDQINDKGAVLETDALKTAERLGASL
jgi:multimeric flavodoxin WrbA